MIAINNLDYTYPFQTQPVLKNINFKARQGEVVLITGASGCGKSTLLRIINGLIPNHFKGAMHGSVTVAGHHLPVEMDLISRSVGTILQNPDDQFMATTIEDEVALALEWQNIPPAEITTRVDDALDKVNLQHIRQQSLFTLSQGEKQKCVIAATLALQPALIVMDEPTANLSPEATDDLREIILKLKSEGTTVIIVDHRLYWLYGVLDQVVVLNHGTVLFQAQRDEADPLDILSQQQLADWGLRDLFVKPTNLPAASDSSHSALLIKQLGFHYSRSKVELFKAFDSILPKASITALTGPNGAGKTTLARLLCGLEKPQSGEICFFGSELKPKKRQAVTAFVMQQMEVQLYMRTVLEELIYSAPKHMPLATREIQANHWLEAFYLSPLRDRHPHSLSGGEKQRLVIACALMKQPQLLILDEPTSGLDGANMRAIAQQLHLFTKQGGTVLLITHDLELLNLVGEYAIDLTPISTETPHILRGNAA